MLNISFILENPLKVTKENGIEIIEEKKFVMVTDKNYFSMYFYFSRNIYILHNYSAYGVYIKNGATFDYDSISVYTVTVRCDDGDDTVDAALTVILIRNDVRYFVL